MCLTISHFWWSMSRESKRLIQSNRSSTLCVLNTDSFLTRDRLKSSWYTRTIAIFLHSWEDIELVDLEIRRVFSTPFYMWAFSGALSELTRVNKQGHSYRSISSKILTLSQSITSQWFLKFCMLRSNSFSEAHTIQITISLQNRKFVTTILGRDDSILGRVSLHFVVSRATTDIHKKTVTGMGCKFRFGSQLSRFWVIIMSVRVMSTIIGLLRVLWIAPPRYYSNASKQIKTTHPHQDTKAL